MYAPQYGYGQNPQQPGQQHQQHQPGYPHLNNPNGGGQPHSHPQHPHPHQQQHQQHQPGQQPPPPQQQMMYNPQAAYAPGSHQSPYGAPGPGMGVNAGGMGMVQNNGLAQVPPGQMSQYQTPYTASPYGAGIPASSPSHLPPNYMPTTSGPPSFQMNASNMSPLNPQQNRMQPPPPTSTPTQRASPYAGLQQHTPPNAGSAPPQYPTSQPPSQNPNMANNSQPHGTVVTPQTPNFPSGSQMGGVMNVAAPLSPGSEIREKERVTLLLNINIALLMEAQRLQTVQVAEKQKDVSAGATGAVAPDGVQKALSAVLAALSKDYVQCMQRLQANLAYLAAIADRSHKPSSQIPSHPAIMVAPMLSSKTLMAPEVTHTEKEEIDEANKENLKELYKQLQGLFPGVDPYGPAKAAAAAAAKAQGDPRLVAGKPAGERSEGETGHGGEKIESMEGEGNASSPKEHEGAKPE